jgi:hypothetical protein
MVFIWGCSGANGYHNFLINYQPISNPLIVAALSYFYQFALQGAKIGYYMIVHRLA